MTAPSDAAPLASVETTSRPRLALALLAAVNFMVILDSQIVILAVPAIAADLSADIADAQWAMSAYLLGFGGLLLLGGRLGDTFGHRRVFLLGTGLFVTASLLCGLAWNLEVLVAARAAHGVSAALMAPTALALLTASFAEASDRNKALAVWGGVGGLGATAALLIGGVTTDALGWEWIFILNVPIGVALLVLTPMLLPKGRPTAGAPGVDVVGGVTLTLGLSTLCLAVARAPEIGWTDGRTAVTFLVAAAALCCFAILERRAAAPLVPPGVFRSRFVACGNAVMFLVGTAAWGVGLATSLYAQNVLGYSPLRFGVGTAVLTVAAMAGSYAAQAALSRTPLRTVTLTGTATAGCGAALLMTVSSDGSYVTDLLPGLTLFGAGLGAATVAASVAALSGPTGSSSGVRAAINTACFQIGGAVGAALVSSVVALRTVEEGAPALTDGLAVGLATTTVLIALAVVLAAAMPRGPGSTGSAGGGDPLGPISSPTDEEAIDATIRRWASSISRRDLQGVLDGHVEDVVMFDVPPPSRGLSGLDEYAASWPAFFDWLEREGVFELESLAIESHGTLAIARALVRCENRTEVSTGPTDYLRVTLALRKVGAAWLISHEHHSFADSSPQQ